MTQILAFALAWWLGLYLLGRDLGSPRLRFTGLGLVTFALGLGLDLLSQNAEGTELSATVARWGWPFLFLPAFFWFGGLFFLLPGNAAPDLRTRQALSAVILPGAVLLYLLAGATNLVVEAVPDGIRPGRGYAIFAAAVLVDLLAASLLAVRSFRSERPGMPLGLLAVATITFGLGIGLLLFPLNWLPRWLLLLAIDVDLVLLGLAVAVLDAFDEGEALLPDFLRSLTFSAFAAVVFGGQVALAMVLGGGASFPMLALLLATIATSVAIQTLADPIQTTLDHLVFARFPRIRQTRANLRAVSSAVARTNETLDPAQLSEAHFARLTRRALSHMGNLPRLAANPLTRLALVEARLEDQGAADNTLERAAELKAILAESIERLKPRDQGDFGTSDEWRHYNALYFPYVAGLKPYSRRANQADVDGTDKEALRWFQAQVPERTLYNWQKAAADLVAQDLRDQLKGLERE